MDSRNPLPASVDYATLDGTVGAFELASADTASSVDRRYDSDMSSVTDTLTLSSQESSTSPQPKCIIYPTSKKRCFTVAFGDDDDQFDSGGPVTRPRQSADQTSAAEPHPHGGLYATATSCFWKIVDTARSVKRLCLDWISPARAAADRASREKRIAIRRRRYHDRYRRINQWMANHKPLPAEPRRVDPSTTRPAGRGLFRQLEVAGLPMGCRRRELDFMNIPDENLEGLYSDSDLTPKSVKHSADDTPRWLRDSSRSPSRSPSHSPFKAYDDVMRYYERKAAEKASRQRAVLERRRAREQLRIGAPATPKASQDSDMSISRKSTRASSTRASSTRASSTRASSTRASSTRASSIRASSAGALSVVQGGRSMKTPRSSKRLADKKKKMVAFRLTAEYIDDIATAAGNSPTAVYTMSGGGGVPEKPEDTTPSDEHGENATGTPSPNGKDNKTIRRASLRQHGRISKTTAPTSSNQVKGGPASSTAPSSHPRGSNDETARGHDNNPPSSSANQGGQDESIILSPSSDRHDTTTSLSANPSGPTLESPSPPPSSSAYDNKATNENKPIVSDEIKSNDGASENLAQAAAIDKVTESLEGLKPFWGTGELPNPFEGALNLHESLTSSTSTQDRDSQNTDEPSHGPGKSSKTMAKGRGKAKGASEEGPPRRHADVDRSGSTIEVLEAHFRRRMPAASEHVIKPLSAEWDSKVASAMRSPPNTTLAWTPSGGELYQKDFETLLPTDSYSSGWLNDKIIMAYLDAIIQHGQDQSVHGATATRHNKATPRYHAFNTYFYSSMRDKGVESVSRWAERAKIGGKKLLETDLIFIPLHLNVHWTLLVLTPKLRRIEYFDSFHGDKSRHVARIREWLQQELGDAYIASEWTSPQARSPTQQNSCDCGVFLVTTAKMIMLGIDPLAVEQADIPTQRRRMMGEIMNRAFLEDEEPDPVDT
ncbi:MAG: hypothetical protein M1825_003162 [Sarcosagium campestre]|nr:MAG: hypothetical protein M1825_003162 [Sarcosagium campestre]